MADALKRFKLIEFGTASESNYGPAECEFELALPTPRGSVDLVDWGGPSECVVGFDVGGH